MRVNFNRLVLLAILLSAPGLGAEVACDGNSTVVVTVTSPGHTEVRDCSAPFTRVRVTGPIGTLTVRDNSKPITLELESGWSGVVNLLNNARVAKATVWITGIAAARELNVVGNTFDENGSGGEISFPVTSAPLPGYEPQIEVHWNDFLRWAIDYGESTFGLASTLEVNAENNWYGDPTGPSHPNNPGGVGVFIDDAPHYFVDFDPWLGAPINGIGPHAEFSWAPDPPDVGNSVQFSLDGHREVDEVSWDLDGDGTFETFVDNPLHTFSAPGDHLVSLEVRNAYGRARNSQVVSVAGNAGPFTTAVLRSLPGVFLDGIALGNDFTATVDWQGTPGTLSFEVSGRPPVVESGTATGATHTFDMSTDFVPDWSPSTVEIVATNGEGAIGPPRTEYVHVFPIAPWLQDALDAGLGGLSFSVGSGEVVASIEAEFPDPHLSEGCTLACAADAMCSDCIKIPEFVPYVGGTFDLLETYGQIEGQVSSLGTGSFNLYGQTGFFALGGGKSGGGVQGSASGSGQFRIFAPDGLELTSASLGLQLQGVLSKEVGILAAVPALAGAEGWPVVGPVAKGLNEIATLTGEIRPSLGFTSHFDQNELGDLEFSEGTGLLGVDLKATLAVPVTDRINLQAWVAGGGDLTVGVPEPFLREWDLRFQVGAEIEVDALFDFCAQATFDASCNWTAAVGSVQCETGGALSGPWCSNRRDLFSVPMRAAEHDYQRFGPYSRFLVERHARRASSRVPASVERLTFTTNIFPGASPHLSETAAGQLLLWEHQDLTDPVLQSTEISWAYDDGNSWTAPALIADDTRVELSPRAAADDTGLQVAAWLRIKDTAFSTSLTEVGDLPLFYTRLEVVSATFDPVLQTWSAPVQLTDDAALDTDLRLSEDAWGNLLLSWLKNPDGEFVSSTTSPSGLLTSSWDSGTGTWSAPATIGSGLAGVSTHQSAVFGTNGFVILERDPDPAASDDRVLDLYSRSAGVWSGPTSFAAGGVDNVLPAVTYDALGEGHVVWVRDGDLVHATLSSPTPTVIRQGSASAAFQGTRFRTNAAGNLTVLWQEVVDNGPADLFARVFDVANSTWSVDRRLTEADGLIEQVQGYYGSDGALHLAMLTSEVLRSDADVPVGRGVVTIPNIPERGQTDLELLDHSLVIDLAVVESDFVVSPVSPSSGDTVSATLMVHNAGDFAVGSFDVDLFLGDPDTGGTLQQTASVSGPFPAGASTDVDLSFTHPGGEGTLIAVVDSTDAVTETFETNNRAAHYSDNAAPVAIVVADATTLAGVPAEVFFDGSVSFDPDGDAISVSWAFSDGSPSVTGPTTTHSFDFLGEFPVTMAVEDEHGAVSTAVVLIKVLADADGDGVADVTDNCPGTSNSDQQDTDADGFGDACDICEGSDDAVDTDADGVADGCDACPGFDDALDADGDSVPDDCDVCSGDDATGDTDADGVCDDLDICAGHDDAADTDLDGVPDGCDVCLGDDATGDADSDGVCDDLDACPGSDDAADADGDGVADGCDLCLGDDASGDADVDGVCDDLDICAGHDDDVDSDGDSVPDGCDVCLGDDASGDADEDTVCNDLDVCAGHDDAVDSDQDSVPDGCDLCLGDDASGDGDGDLVCADLDCADDDVDAQELDGCGVCGGDNSSCGLFQDGFETGDVNAWAG